MKKHLNEFKRNIVNSVISIGQSIPEGWTKNTIRKAHQQYKDIRSVRQLRFLEVVESGVDEDLAFIELVDGERYYGFKSGKKGKRRHDRYQNSETKLIPEAYFVAEQYYSYYVDPPWDRELFYDISKGDIVLDVGSNQGYYTRKLSNKVGKDGLVIAIEAHPNNYRVLERNAEEAVLDNIIPVNVAASNKSGSVEFYERRTTSGRHHIVGKNDFNDIGEKLEVPSKTIDSILSKKGIEDVDFATITINHHEYEALQGMENTLESGLHIAGPLRPYEQSKILLDSHGYSYKEVTGYEISPILYASRTL